MAEKKDTGLVNIHGKQYKTVALRVNEFRDDPKNAGYGLITEVLERNEIVVVVRASVVNDKGVTVATGHAEEYRDDKKSTVNKTSALENAETSAIGRCLSAYGLAGTEFASADEVAHAITSKAQAPAVQQLKPVSPQLEAYRKYEVWGRKYWDKIVACGLGDQWKDVMDRGVTSEIEYLMDRVRTNKKNEPDYSPVREQDIP
jgi:hypothetical protein